MACKRLVRFHRPLGPAGTCLVPARQCRLRTRCHLGSLHNAIRKPAGLPTSYSWESGMSASCEGSSPMPQVSKSPGRLVLGAARIRAVATLKKNDPLSPLDLEHADKLENVARTPLALAAIGIGGELVPAENDYLRHSVDLKHTVRAPDYRAARATQRRLGLADAAHSLEAALDAAGSIDPQNSFERMLAHQMALVHRCVMKLGQRFDEQANRLQGMIDRDAFQGFNVEMCRTAGAMARMAGAFQDGHALLHRLRNGGSQTVVVQHVRITDGGQAVVAGEIRGAAAQKRHQRSKNDG